MKVLWFTGTSSNYGASTNKYNGEGWIFSLQKVLITNPSIELGLSFFHSDKCFKCYQDGITFYPIQRVFSLYSLLFNKSSQKKYIKTMLNIIADYKPDIIHVFGTEKIFGIITKYTNIPVVIHQQGIINPYLNAFFPPGISMFNAILNNGFSLNESIKLIKTYYSFKRLASLENAILKSCKYFMGRTKWDKAISLFMNPEGMYFNCNEVLRDDFYLGKKRIYNAGKHKIKLVSTISAPLYKGFDLILKTAKLLIDNTNLDFEWIVFGNVDKNILESYTSIKCNDVNIILYGVANSDELTNIMTTSDIYIHPSYIDNSPNSICEAQILGLPVISTNVGGIPSLIEDKYSGILIPANDPYFLASCIISLLNDVEMLSKISKNARQIALMRHDKNNIAKDLLEIYTQIIKLNNHILKLN